MEKRYTELLEKMKQKYCDLAGSVPNDASDVGIRMKVLAQELSLLWEKLDFAESQLFPTTAKGDYLDLHAQNRGLTRKKGCRAQGKVEFSRESDATNPIPIPKGTVVSTGGSNAIRFVTTKDIQIEKGERSVLAGVECAEVGSIGNVAIGAVKILITPLSGISCVSNKSLFTSGTDIESDEQLRKRLFEDYKKVSNGTNVAFYYHKVMEHEGITSANVIPRAKGIGTVEVVVDSLNTDVSEELLSELKDELDFLKEINVDVEITVAEKKFINLEIELATSEGFTYSQAEEACCSAIKKQFSDLGVAKALFVSDIIKNIALLDEVANCSVKQPTGDIRPTERQILRCGNITIREMSVI